MYSLSKTMLMSFFLCLFTLFMSCEDSQEPEDDDKIIPPFEVFACSDCDFIVDDFKTDGEALGISPGDVVCLKTGENYGKLEFTKIKGTAAEPVIIRNCEGPVSIGTSDGTYGVKFTYCENFKLLGDGVSTEDYGIKIQTPKGFFLTMEFFTTDFEIARTEITKNPSWTGSGFAGIGIKTSPYQDCNLFTDPTRQAWIMKNIIIRDNYIHDVGGEGLYIGHGFYTGRREADCPSTTYSHSIQNIEVYNNIIENTGYDGIQIKNTDMNVAIHDNLIKNYGTRDDGPHNEGLFIGEGTTGDYYNNVIVNGTGNGIQLQGMGNMNIYNNIIANAGDHGFVAYHGNYVYRIPDGYFNILNNTIVNSENIGFVFYHDGGGVKRVINNIIAVAPELQKNGAELSQSNNIFTQDLSELAFVNPAELNYLISDGSSAIDAGIDVSEYGVTKDIEGEDRPAGSAYDVGADEF